MIKKIYIRMGLLIFVAMFILIIAAPAFASTNIIDTVAGGGTASSIGYTGLPTGAALNNPNYVKVDSNGNIYFSDTSNNVVREVAATTHTQFGISMTAGDIYTVAGNGTQSHGGDNGPAISAELNTPLGIAVDGNGNLFIADSGGGMGDGYIREVANATGNIEFGTAATTMTAGDIYALASVFNYPYCIAFDNHVHPNMFIANY
jgi:sugar lactone lactonase YvrE